MSSLGQFYTTNYDYILQRMEIPSETKYIIEPFAGRGDLLKFIKDKEKYQLELYDIDPKKDNIIKRDTLKEPPDYKDKFVLTNPPYLARNKNKNKELYDKYKCNDLYKCFILNLIASECQGGIIIVPLNFISSNRKADQTLRAKFLAKYSIRILNIFEEKVFDDTAYSVCSIQFVKKDENKIKVYIYPSKKEFEISLTKENNYTFGGELYNLAISKDYKIERATKSNYKQNNITNILLKCIDDSIESKLCLSIVKDKDRFIDQTENLTARSYATLIISPKLTLDKQRELVSKFNEYIKKKRDEYHSLFLTNYRESNSIARKRISFELAFRICNYILSSMNS